MGSADLWRGATPAGAVVQPPAAPATDYHALGAFTETWAFLELFLGRCAEAAGAQACGDAVARAIALEAAVAGRADLRPLHGRIRRLAQEVVELSEARQGLTLALAEASLHRLGLACLAAAAPPEAGKSLEGLHMRACDLVRRSALLLGELKARRGGSA